MRPGTTASRWPEWYGLAVPFALLAIIVTVDVLFAPEVAISAAYNVAAVAAAAITTVGRTVLVAVVAVLLAALSGIWSENLGTLDWTIRLMLTVALGALAVIAVAIRVQRERELRHMTAIAETAQRAMLRVMPREVGSVGFAARYVSATQAALMGGDLYEVADTRYGVRLIVGDVRGKGLAGVQMASSVLAAFRRAAERQAALAAVARELDVVVQAVAGDEDFVTAVIVEFPDDRSVRVVNCGHHAPLLISDPNTAELIDTGPPQLPLGLGPEPRSVKTWWPDGARLLLYTDGLIETRDSEGEFFPLTECAGILGKGDLGEALDNLLLRVNQHAGDELDDDMALVLAEHRTAWA